MKKEMVRFARPSFPALVAQASVAVGLSLTSAACSASANPPRVLSASAGAAAGGHEAYGVTMAQGAGSGVRVGQTRVVDAHVQPLVPVRTSLEGDVLSIRYTHPRAGGAVAHLSSESLAPVSPEAQVPAERPTAPSEGAVRVVLDGGRFIECFRRGSLEHGYRLMAQAWTAHGSRVGQPVPISPPEADVTTAPQLVSVDGRRAVATFVTASGERFELLAVSLEVL